MKLVVTGATGYLGVPLVAALIARGDTVAALVRDPARAPAGVTAITAELESPGPWCDALAGADAVVHLAGEPVAGKRWDARQKQRLRDSRVETTRTIVEAIAALPAARRPRALICASGADYYPFASGLADFDDDPVTEVDPPGDSFLARLCRDWEREASTARAEGLRVVTMRTGLVLGPDGGALRKMMTPFKLFVGGRIADGMQWVSWIHRDDAIAAYLAAIADERYAGAVNLVAPEPVRNHELARALGRALHRPSLVPVPAFALKLALGEIAEYVIHGRRVVPAVLTQRAFEFRRPTLASALADL